MIGFRFPGEAVFEKGQADGFNERGNVCGEDEPYNWALEPQSHQDAAVTLGRPLMVAGEAESVS